MIDCPACEKRISSSATACPSCGHPANQPVAPTAAVDYAGVPVAAPANETMALIAMICGVGCVVLAFTPFASWLTGLLAAVATILSIVALAKIKRGMATGLGMAVTGLVCGVIGLLMFALALIGVFLLGVGNG